MREAHVLLLGLLALHLGVAANAWSWPALKGACLHIRVPPVLLS